MPAELDELVDELYALPLERFVPERDVLVKQLRAEKRRSEAAEVAALQKPSVVAWAVNQVVRAQRDAAAALWAAGDAVLEVQARLVAGDAKGPELRAAIEAEREALAPLTDAARGLMTTAGKFLGDANVTGVVETLHAAAIDPGARAEVAAGRMARPLRLTGLEATLATGPTRTAPAAPPPEDEPEPPAGRRSRSSTTTKARQLAIRDEQDAEAEAERRRAERERRAAQKAAEQALLRAERERDRARKRIAAAVAERDAADAAVAQARERLGRAEEDLATAHDALEQAEDVVDRAQAEVRGE